MGFEAGSLGLDCGRVVVVPYDPRWQVEFAVASGELQDAPGTSILAIHHVGSTAIPGLCAKPVLDILVSVSDFDRSLELVPYLEKLGYEFRAEEEIPDRHFFRRRRGTARTHHLSLAEPTSLYHAVTLAFRDALRTNAAAAQRYCEIKMDLARRFPHDREAYIQGKSSFVAHVLAQIASDDERLVTSG